LTLIVYTATIFTSAALLFAIQPMFAKMVLPRLGGAPAVWSVAMVFFQGMLLAGYAYAHVLTRMLPGWPSALVHVAIMSAAAFTLPLAVAAGWGPPPADRESVWLVGLFAASIGLPFFALSANGPLLQAWFARTPHPSAHDPYFLYAASNVGSFMALLAYPLAIEPFARLGLQTRAWSVLFILLIGFVAICGVILARVSGATKAAAIGGTATPAPSWRDAGRWVALAAIPSGLLIAVTAHLSTDVAAVPLMWVMPLALYLASFVIVFQSRPLLPHAAMVAIQPALIVLLVAVLVFEVTGYLMAVIALTLLAFFVTAMVCHGELARRRPAADHLTAFYLWMSLGGVIGGLSAGLLAPQLFSWIAEYPLLIVLAILCRPGVAAPRDLASQALWATLAALIALIAAQQELPRWHLDDTVYRVAMVVLLTVSLLVWRFPLRFAIVIAFAILAGRLYAPDGRHQIAIRSFYGVHKILDTEDGEYRVLLHGTTIHGAQRLTEDEGKPLTGPPEPLTYYHASSPMAQTIDDARARLGRPLRVAVVGLGTGSLACHAQPGDAWRFYEIDASVVRFSRDAPLFDFLRRCAPDAGIVLGDARLTLAADRNEPYDLIVVDAFSSDAIPVHLLTREAVAVYATRLAARGVLALHVSNRHLELATVAAGIADANGLASLVSDGLAGDLDEAGYKYASTVIVAARSEADLAGLGERKGWSKTEIDPRQWVWTDDYSNVAGAVVRRLRR
jgi:hypothetical protein